MSFAVEQDRSSFHGDMVAATAGSSLSALFSDLRPDWHSAWAWENYDATVLALARRLRLNRLCEIGGGRDPGFLPGNPALEGLSLSDYLLGEVRRAAERPPLSELVERLKRRAPVRVRPGPAEAVRREREGR